MTSRRGPKDDDELGHIEDEIAIWSYVGRMARFFFNLATFFVFDDAMRSRAQREAGELERRADERRERAIKRRNDYRKDNRWR